MSDVGGNAALKIDKAGAVTLESSGDLKIKAGASLNIEASGELKLKGAVINLN